jgi:hypothetical protein
MTNAYVVTGTLIGGKTVQLDESLPAAEGKVRVTVEVIAPPPAAVTPGVAGRAAETAGRPRACATLP